MSEIYLFLIWEPVFHDVSDATIIKLFILVLVLVILIVILIVIVIDLATFAVTCVLYELSILVLAVLFARSRRRVGSHEVDCCTVVY